MDTIEEEAEVDIGAVQKEINALEGELAEVRVKMTTPGDFRALVLLVPSLMQCDVRLMP